MDGGRVDTDADVGDYGIAAFVSITRDNTQAGEGHSVGVTVSDRRERLVAGRTQPVSALLLHADDRG